MAAKLQEGKSLEREIHVYGIESPVIISISNEGFSAKVKGSRIVVTQGWVQVLQATNTPNNVPSFLHGKPYEFLQHQARKSKERAEKREDAGKELAV